MPLYRIDVEVAATLYVRAATAAAVQQCAARLRHTNFSELIVSERPFDAPELPDVSVSPAMTVVGPYPDQRIERVA